jgi:RNA polymerase sigma factor (sigma-70 family)
MQALYAAVQRSRETIMAQTEAVLLKRFTGSGDAEAFAEIIRRHAGLVYGAALRILADVDRASDVAQETFLQLTKDAGHVTGSLPGWLHRVATHKAIDLMRRDASRHHREREYAANEQPPCEPVEWKEISPYVDVGLRELDPELRDVLILHFLQGRTTREIALLKGASQATISRRIGSGVEQLRVKLRRRGILLAVGALSVLLGDNGVQAAPLPLLTELGKMAIVGGSGVSSATGVAWLGSSFGAILTGIWVALKTQAAVAAIGVGAIVIYQEATRPASSQPAVAASVGWTPRQTPLFDPPIPQTAVGSPSPAHSASTSTPQDPNRPGDPNFSDDPNGLQDTNPT